MDLVKFPVRRHSGDRLTKSVSGAMLSMLPTDLEKLQEKDRDGSHIYMVTQHKLRLGNEILWCGCWYRIQSLEPCPRFGPEFIQTIAGSIGS